MFNFLFIVLLGDVWHLFAVCTVMVGTRMHELARFVAYSILDWCRHFPRHARESHVCIGISGHQQHGGSAQICRIDRRDRVMRQAYACENFVDDRLYWVRHGI